MSVKGKVMKPELREPMLNLFQGPGGVNSGFPREKSHLPLHGDRTPA